MKYHTDDVRITGMQEVIAPDDLLAELPMKDQVSQLVFTTRSEISDIIHGRDHRLVVVVGPCSIHDPIAALEYADRITITDQDVSDAFFDRLKEFFDDDEIVELTATIAWENCSSKFNRALRVESQQLWSCD